MGDSTGDSVGANTGSSSNFIAPVLPPLAGIIFETNFVNDAAFAHTGPTSFPWTNIASIKPEGFSGTLIEGNGRIYGVAGEGVAGSVAMRFEWGDLSQPVTQLFKHLTDDQNTGYDEIFLRYRVRLPNNILMGDTAIDDFAYWKWARLWQNNGPVSAGVTENRADSGFAVMNFGGTATWGVYAGGTFAANFDATGLPLSGGSANGARYSIDYYDGFKASYVGTPGALNNMGSGAWDFDKTTRILVNNTTQTWHTIEWRCKLATSDTANDGVYQIWFDGVEQIPIVDMRPKAPTPVLADLLPGEIPTASRGSGYNFLVLFDNLQFVNGNWDTPGTIDGNNGIWINDLVISTKRIGHNHVAGNTDNTGVGAT